MSIAWSMLLLQTQRLLRALLREWTVEACPILLFKQSTGSVLKSKWLMLLTKIGHCLFQCILKRETTFN